SLAVNETAVTCLKASARRAPASTNSSVVCFSSPASFSRFMASAARLAWSRSGSSRSQLPFHLGQRVVDTGACALKGEDCRVCAGCRFCIFHVSFDKRAPPWFRCSLDFSSHRSAAGHKSLLSRPKPRNRPPQVGDWISDLSQHGCLLRFRKLATSRSQGADRFAYFFAPFAKMESDRSNSQNRVAHAS